MCIASNPFYISGTPTIKGVLSSAYTWRNAFQVGFRNAGIQRRRIQNILTLRFLDDELK